jgi:hypothetical protein
MSSMNLSVEIVSQSFEWIQHQQEFIAYLNFYLSLF